jgi:hypothetical protein
MKLLLSIIIIASSVAACGGSSEYEKVTDNWTRKGEMRQRYQEALTVAVTFKSLQWREAFARKTAEDRGLEGPALDQQIAQAKADDAGPVEFQMIVVTWDRRENDLDRGKKSVWKIRLLDDAGMEVEPLEIIKDKRPDYIIRAEFPEMKNFAVAYVVRFPRDKVPNPGTNLRMHMSSPRGGVRLIWAGRST